jgi:hypothetical protein
MAGVIGPRGTGTDPALRWRFHPLVPPVALIALAVPVVGLTAAGVMVPFMAWVLMGAAAGYSLSGSV